MVEVFPRDLSSEREGQQESFKLEHVVTATHWV